MSTPKAQSVLVPMRIGKAILITMLTVSLLLATAITAMLGTETGRLWGANKAIQTALHFGIDINISNLTFPQLGKMHFDELTITKNNAVWINIKDFSLQWQPKDLFSKKITVKNLNIQALNYYHLSADNNVKAKKTTLSAKTLASLWSVHCNVLSINALRLHNISSTPSLPSYSVKGNAVLFDANAPLSLNLNAYSLPDKSTHLSISTQLHSLKEVQFQGSLKEAPANFIGSLLYLPKNQALDIGFDATLLNSEDSWQLSFTDLTMPFLNHSLAYSGAIHLDKDATSIRVAESTLTIDNKIQRVQGGADHQNIWFDLDLKKIPLDIASPWLTEPLSGWASLRTTGNWLYKSNRLPITQFKLDSSINVHDQAVTLKAAGETANELIQLEPSSATVEQTNIDIGGTVDLFKNKNALDFKISNFDSSILQPWQLNLPINASIKTPLIDGHISNSIKNPTLSLKTNAAVTILNEIPNDYFNPTLKTATHHLLSLGLNATLNKDKGFFRHLEVNSAEHHLNAIGEINWSNKSLSIKTSFKNINNSLLQFLPIEVTEQLPPNITFNANGNLSASGEFKNPNIEADISVQGDYVLEPHSEIQNILPYHLEIQAKRSGRTLNDANIDIDLIRLSLFKKTVIQLEGKINHTHTDLLLELNRLPTQTFELLGWRKFIGEAQGVLRLEGTPKQPKLNGNIRYISHAPAQNNGYTPNYNIESTFVTHKDALSIGFEALQNNQSIGKFDVTLPIAPYLNFNDFTKGPMQDMPIALTAKGNIDLKVASWFINKDVHQLSGNIHSDVSITGTLRHPKIDGIVSTTNTRYRNSVLDLTYDNIHMELIGKNNLVTISKLKATDQEGGLLKLTGSVKLAPEYRTSNKMIKAVLIAKDASLTQAKALNGKIHGDLNIVGNLSEIWIQGKAKIQPLNISIAKSSKTSIPTIKYSERAPANQKLTAKTSVIHLDINLITEQQAFIRGRGLDTELTGGIQLTGTTDNISYRGEFKTLRGRIEAFGKRFILKTGFVQVSNKTISLNIVATHTTAEYEFKIELLGTQEEPIIKLSSVPALPDDEILAYLIFGKSIHNISSFQAIQLASAVQTLANGSSFDPIESTRNALGVDSLTIDNEETEDGDSKISLGIGKYVNERIYVELKHTPNPTQPWQGRVEVELTPDITLQSSTNDTGGARGDIVWKRDY